MLFDDDEIVEAISLQYISIAEFMCHVRYFLIAAVAYAAEDGQSVWIITTDSASILSVKDKISIGAWRAMFRTTPKVFADLDDFLTLFYSVSILKIAVQYLLKFELPPFFSGKEATSVPVLQTLWE